MEEFYECPVCFGKKEYYCEFCKQKKKLDWTEFIIGVDDPIIQILRALGLM